jgi:hypothetical protein
LQLGRHSAQSCRPATTSFSTSEVFLAAVYKSAGRAWSDADITEFLSFRRKSILGGDLNGTVSNASGEKLMALFDLNEF